MTLSVQEYDESGKDLTLSAASAGGDQFPNTGKEELIIKNGSGSAITVTVAAQDTSFEDKEMGNAVKENQQVSVSANGGVAVMGPFPRRAFNDGSGNVQITYSGTTSLEVAVAKQN